MRIGPVRASVRNPSDFELSPLNVEVAMRPVWLLVLCSVGAGGCAHTSFYSDEALKKETGFRYYAPKPYLLVQRTGAKDKPVDISIVYLPNLMQPQFAKPHAGWGSSDFSLALSNGIATQVGQKLDSKGPETITALASVATSVGGLAKALADAGKVRAETAGLREEGASVEVRFKAAALLKSASTVLTEYASYGASGAQGLITPTQRATATDAAKRLAEDAVRLEDPHEKAPEDAVVADVKKTLADLEKLAVQASPNDIDGSRLAGRVTAITGDLKEVVKLLNSEPARPDFEIYEIVQSDGRTTLVPVTAP
jgi:hypothetical protein